ncbi:hypothetical protein Smp_032790 [Schistosoma mansoni]|uniref:Essential MCU regulator, mitochondrial n=1 Tax=Schistosoma mansoni TaxID=6183 RepID=G4VDI1_SCHMA|nr:hypothetical protein Smp_032790 [Schistosoma mansoni]|eukprot:XP_018649593.1 hypothetical protein Smp_032790 [Schistosoma mansoni]
MLTKRLIENVLRCQHQKYLPTRGMQCYSGESGSCSSTGALHCRPLTTPLGLVKITCVVISSICTGAWISRNGAEFLEENEIFVPEDD